MVLQSICPSNIPLSLLLVADPSRANINSYLPHSRCFSLSIDDKIIGACVTQHTSEHSTENTTEIFNIAIQPEYQKQGFGTALLTFVLKSLAKKGTKYVELGTGAFGHQLSYYHRMGFRVKAVIKNHFIEHYDKKIIENGIQHKDMLRLYLKL